MRKISIFGTGYVGLATGACLADVGHTVTCVDIDSKRIANLQLAKPHIYEVGLEDILSRNVQSQRLNFTTQYKEAVENSDILIITAGTPSDENGFVDLEHIFQAVSEIGSYINNYKVIVIKSTVPVGTHKKISQLLEKILHDRGINHEFAICSNPEFLREGTALNDSFLPYRIVIGTESKKAFQIMSDLYRTLNKNIPIIFMDPTSSEMTKYVANAMLAGRISLMNEFSRLCEKMGADIDMVRQGLELDPRIGQQYLQAGLGYGGGCLPKDLRALIYMGQENNESMNILKAIESTNTTQKKFFFKKISSFFEHQLQNLSFAVWGASFKPGTDDIREAPSLYIIEELLKAGAHVHLFDPAGSESVKKYFTNKTLKTEKSPNLFCADDPYTALKNAEALLILTDWPEFIKPDFNKMKTHLKTPVIFDGRNIYSSVKMKELGFIYRSIGRQ